MARKGYSRIAFIDPSKVNSGDLEPMKNNNQDHL
jgi:hypothetical protein